jgi:phospho-N-acetylmuramoyl-pentapeptide-transferase
MLFLLKFLSSVWGPFRMLGSHLVLMCLGALVASVVVWWGLPRLWNRLPQDRGKGQGVPGGEKSKGKPTGAGRWMLMLLLPVLLLVLPLALPGVDRTSSVADVFRIVREIAADPTRWWQFVNQQWGVVFCLMLAMLTGYADDHAIVPWGELKKGLWDALIAVLTAVFLCMGRNTVVWLPVTTAEFVVSPFVFVPCAALLLWFAMNATNCTDGVDGLAGTLTLMSLFALSAFLYGVVGHAKVASYLIVPHHVDGARWGILTATVAGGVAGYLWHNAEPSRVLMGDAGSRPLGLLVGVAVLASGNPFLVFVVSPIVLLNGGTGLVKLALLRGLKRLGVDTRPPSARVDDPPEAPGTWRIVHWLHSVRFPLHDHCRKNLHWSNAQVLMRFVLLQAFLTPILFLLIVKVR